MVVVVLPWSTWPIVPTLTCGLVRSNVPLAIWDGDVVFVCGRILTEKSRGAQSRTRTGDLVLTKDVLYQLSYLGATKLRQKTRKERRT